MPVRRRQLDGMTRDYVLAQGSPSGDSTKMQKVLIRLFTRRGSIPSLPSLGNRAHEVQKATTSSARVVRGHIFEALDDLVRNDEIQDLEVDVEVVPLDGGGAALGWDVSFHDRGDDDVRQVKWTQKFGGRS